ncbi:MAG: ECF transporter S component [Candidatus Humimicrobiaceae bacterium]
MNDKSLKKEYGWNTLDIVMVAIIGVIFSILYWAYNQLFAFLWPFISGIPPVVQIFVGFWFIAGIVAGYVIQKPGAAFLGEVIAALVSMLLGSMWGVWIIVSGLVQGAATEGIFAAYRYKKFNYLTVCLAGIFTALVSFFFPEAITEGFLDYRISIIIAMLVVRIISGAILGGALGKVISDAVAKTGILRNFKLGKNR